VVSWRYLPLLVAICMNDNTSGHLLFGAKCA
jgi:hypothetical protein